MRKNIEELKKEFHEITKDIPKEQLDRLTDILDELFIAYFFKAKEKGVEEILESIGHYERHVTAGLNVHAAIEDFRAMLETGSDAAVIYRLRKAWDISFKEGTLDEKCDD